MTAAAQPAGPPIQPGAAPAAYGAAVITCSDSAAAGSATDTSGPLAADLLRALGHELVGPVLVVPDDAQLIMDAVRGAVADGARIVVTTGGTGASPRDVTPEALRALGLRELPGLGEAIRAAARERVPAADLSRSLGGVLEGAVVLALPGSPGGVRDGLAAVGGLLAHAVAMASGGGHAAPRSPEEGVHRAERPPTVAPAAAGASPSSTSAPSDPGDPAVLVRTSPLLESEVAGEVAHPAAGAVVTFAGVVRDHDHGREVVALHYEGHPDADRVMAQVLAEARTRPGVVAAAARHRVGDLAIGDLAFVAAVSAAHRAEAFAACAWLVDTVKERLPVWKHQHFADGTDEWVNCA